MTHEELNELARRLAKVDGYKYPRDYDFARSTDIRDQKYFKYALIAQDFMGGE